MIYLVFNSRMYHYIDPIAAFLNKADALKYCEGKLYMCIQEVKLK